jgi:cytidylate kinase
MKKKEELDKSLRSTKRNESLKQEIEAKNEFPSNKSKEKLSTHKDVIYLNADSNSLNEKLNKTFFNKTTFL